MAVSREIMSIMAGIEALAEPQPDRRDGELGGHALLTRLLEEDAGLAVDAAEVDQVRIGSNDRGDDAVEVRLLLGALEAQHGHAIGLGGLAEELGHALPVGGLVVDDVDACDAHLFAGEGLTDDTLHIVTTDDAVDFGIAALGDGRVRVGR